MIVAYYIKLCMATCKTELKIAESSHDVLLNKKPAVFVSWHSRFLMFLYYKQFGSFQAVTSASKDGEYMESILKFFNHTAIRGSSRNKGTEALRAIFKIPPHTLRLFITPDGPKGPRFQINGNVENIARKFNVPIIPICYSASRAKVFKTWDRFIIPIPFISKIILEFGDLFEPTPDCDIRSKMFEQMVRLDKSCNLKIDY